MSSINYALMNVTFSPILGEAMASVTSEEFVAIVKAFLLRMLTIVNIREQWILSS